METLSWTDRPLVYHNLHATQKKGSNSRAYNLVGNRIIFLETTTRLKDVFMKTTSWKIGDGKSVSYWFDAWQGLPKAKSSRPRLLQPTISLRDGWPIRQTLQPLEDHTGDYNLIFSSDEDRLEWNWTKEKMYTASSFYQVMVSGGRIRWHHGNMQRYGIARYRQQYRFSLL